MIIAIILLVALGLYLAKENPKLRKGIAYAALGLAVITVLHIGFNLTTSQKNAVSAQSENVVVGDINNHQHEKQQFIP